jgi:hypothetical protein
MRAKAVNEFEQGRDPYETMGLGQRKKIREWVEQYNFFGCTVTINDDNSVTIDGDFKASGHTDLDWLPNNLTVNGHLDLAHHSIKELPMNLHVAGNLNLSWTNLNPLNKNLSVNGFIVSYWQGWEDWNNTQDEIDIFFADDNVHTDKDDMKEAEHQPTTFEYI